MSIKSVITLNQTDNIELSVDGELRIEEGIYNIVEVRLETEHLAKLKEKLEELGY